MRDIKPQNELKGKIHKAWAGMALLVLLVIYSLAWVGRALVQYLTATGAMKPALALAAVFGVGAIYFITARGHKAEAKARFTLAGGVFAISQLFAWFITRTAAESVHVVEYELLACCIYMSLAGIFTGRNLRAITLLLILIAGWSDELMQSFVPDRYYDLADVLLNLASGAFGVAITHIIFSNKEIN